MALETRTEVHGSGSTPSPVATPRRYPTMVQSIGLFVARVPLGAYFLLAGVAKLRGGVGKFVEGSLSTAREHLPEKWASIYLNALPYAEIVLGGMLILGLLTRVTSFIMSALLVSFIMAVTGIKHEALPFEPNLIFLGLALGLVFCGPGRLSIDGLLFGPRRTVTITEKYVEPLP